MKATRRLFDEDSRLTRFEAAVVSCLPDGGAWSVVLDQTAFFPEEGGQMCDRGLLAGQTVLHVSEKDHVIYHRVADPLAAGIPVTGEIDWEKRFSDMQQHSGEHIVSGLVHAAFGYDNVGFHLGSESVTMDYSGPLGADQLREIEEKANRAVWANLPVSVTWPSEKELETLAYRSKKELEGPIRIVEIPGIDICACCAPHVHHTGEIGLIKLTGAESYKGGTRVYMLCGRRAMEDYRKKQESVSAVSALLSARPDEIQDAVRRQKQECGVLRFEANGLRMALVGQGIGQIVPGGGAVCFFSPFLSKDNIKRAWDLLCERFPESLCACFAGDDARGYQFLLGGAGNAREAGSALLGAFPGKGGGSPQVFQGRISALKEEIEDYFKRCLTNQTI